MRKRALSLVSILAVAATFFSPSVATDAIDLTTSITGNQTIVSAGGVFLLGFFSPPGAGGKSYVGIWYASVHGPGQTVVWVANRQDPVVRIPGVFKLSDDGQLVILDRENITVWSSPVPTMRITTRAAAQLGDDGNFILTADGSDSAQSVAWQSFDYPTDTLLPGMKLGVDLKKGITTNITSWSSPADPSPGIYTFKLVKGALPEFFLFEGPAKIYGSGPYNGAAITGVPRLNSQDITFTLVSSPDETYYSYSIRTAMMLSRFVVNGTTREIRRYVWANGVWNSYWYYPTDPCDRYGKCGPFGYCDMNQSSLCSCLQGFEPRSPQQWGLRINSGGCVRSTKLSCNASDGFWPVNRMKLPETTNATVHAGMTLDQCRQECLDNCSCRAYAAATDNGGVSSVCVIWAVDLLDMKQYTDQIIQDVYIRLAQSEIDTLNATANGHRRQQKSGAIAVAVAVAGVLLLGAVVCFCFWTNKARRKRQLQAKSDLLPFRARKHYKSTSSQDQWLDENGMNGKEDIELPFFALEAILIATNDFAASSKIGQGGFGPVYMGKLEDGRQVAVKRLSSRSVQGVGEFKNEVKLISKLQHRNLVRLLGCCIDRDERMLVYEFMENNSLDASLFDEEKRKLLGWSKRFDIILGIARGLLYLHEDSRFRIIHRDLKASNVLLDKNMVPKISDFGIARMIGGDQTTAYTKKVIGTYGYMSPEYIMDGVFSMKSDVYSFGVMVLEIVTGKRNRGFYEAELDLNLLRYAWMMWREGRCMYLADEAMGATFNSNEVCRCIQVALLCVEVQPKNRPLMSSVVMMLASKNATLAEPNEPGVNIGRTTPDTVLACQGCTANEMTVTAIEDR